MLEQIPSIDKAVSAGLATFRAPTPQRLSDWAEEHFYLSAESSYSQGRWECYPYQRGLMDLMTHDDIREVWFLKSARVGFSKCLLAAMFYYAEHRRRNQAFWLPVDSDRDEFVKTEVDPALRDVPVMQRMFPDYGRQTRNNTLQQKNFLGSVLYLRGGKSARGYRRISVDVCYLDEYSAFDQDIEGEGTASVLAGKRLEGSVFPKLIGGSTPKIAGECLTEAEYEHCHVKLRFEVPCPHCDEFQHLKFGGRGIPYGLKWEKGDVKTVAYLCEHCACLFTQTEFLDVWHRGRWRDAEKGIRVDAEARFITDEGAFMDAPRRVGMHLWTAYSPMTTWETIIWEFIAALKDKSKMKTFVNTTLGETFVDDDIERLDRTALINRREQYTTDIPAPVLALVAGIDTQDDRFEVTTFGVAPGYEMFAVDHTRIYGDLNHREVWDALRMHLLHDWRHENGGVLNVLVAAQDHGGHFSEEVNRFSRRMGTRFVVPVKGSSVYGKPLITFPRRVNRNRVYLTEVGTDTAKDLLQLQLGLEEHGPGYWHWPVRDCFDQRYFEQLTGEERVKKFAQGRYRHVWINKGRQVEALDCTVYAMAAVRIATQHFGLVITNPDQERQRAKLKLRQQTKMTEDAYVD